VTEVQTTDDETVSSLVEVKVTLKSAVTDS